MEILIVEDNEDSRNLLMKQLRVHGHEVTPTVNGVEALQQALAQPPDIIISDILMPKMDGYQLCQECKQNDKLKNIPFVFHTATYLSEEDEKFGLSLGANSFIYKTTEPDALVQMLSEIVEKAQSGALASAEVAPLEPSLFLAEHDKRIFTKLEDKVTQLEAEITQRKQIERNLNERVKELQCLYGIANIAERPGITLDELYQEVGNLLPKGWQYSEITCVRLTINSQEFCTKNFRETRWKQTSDIVVQGDRVGNVEVCYLDERPEIDEGPFLKEERDLINAIARHLSETIERRQAEEALQIAEANFHNSLDNSPLGIRIVTTEGELLYANQALLDIYGYSSVEELKATHRKERYTPRSYAEHQERVQMRKQGKPVPSIYEVSIVHKNGEIRHLIVSRKAVVWGGEVQYQVVYQDTTERRQAEEKIKRTAEEWSTTFDSIADFVSICDKDFRLVRVNKAFADLLKKKPEELVGKHCYEVFHGTNEPVLNCPHKKTMKTKKPAIAEYFEPHLGIHLEIATSPIFDEKGEVVASVHVARDITERKKMEEQLIVTDRLASIGELSSGIAHELNNPLTGVIGFSDLLLDRDLPDDIKEDVEIISREAKRTAGVVRNLLTFARKHEIERKRVNINNIIEKVLELRAYEQKVSNIEVNTRFASDLPEIMADGFRLQQVFLNIIINAEHFMTEAHGRGTFTITTERVGDIIRASFSDDGPGIAKENLGHLFDPFFTTKEVGKGTGLGLSISYGIITEHSGRIYAESELGKGATFVIELPIATTDNEGTVE